ncbi:hypothetical protein GCM10022276_10560 [Sphingomonas limnosediminicola]|uniref:Glycosyltransferase 2-like domain-containing protein n=1 Tax=Sphingomonas limnosediminicola TaxID=940133 RepID=A0ABP7L562_9SPHN
MYNRLADEEWCTPIGMADACGGDSLVRLAAIDEVGPFNPRLMASEEPELAARLRNAGWQIWRLDAAMCEHDARILTFAQWWRRTTRSGYGYAQAWAATRNIPEQVNVKLLRSSIAWVLVLPAVTAILAVSSRSLMTLLLLPLLYSAQILRMAARRPDRTGFGLKASAMLMLAKVPELIGAARFVVLRRRSSMIEYKGLVPRGPGND